MASSPQPVYVSLDLQSLALLGLVPEPRASDPGSPAAGRVWYRTDLKQISAYDGGAVQRYPVSGAITNADINAAAAIAETKLALASDAAAGTASRRTLGTGALQALAGNTRLDQISQPTTAVNFGGQRATNAADPTGSTDLTTQQWVLNQLDARVNGQDWKASVRARVGVNVSVTSAPATLDGITPTVGDRFLLAAQTTGSENGIRVWNGAGVAMPRATDADSAAEVTAGMTVPIEDGTSADTIWLLTTNNPITLDTTPLSFSQIGPAGSTYTAGSGLTLVGNQFSLTIPVAIASGGTNATTAPAARTSLSVPRSGVVLAVPSLTAGVEQSIAHGTGTGNAVAQVRRVSDGTVVQIGIRTKDTTNVFVQSDVAVGSGVLELVYSPIDG